MVKGPLGPGRDDRDQLRRVRVAQGEHCGPADFLDTAGVPPEPDARRRPRALRGLLSRLVYCHWQCLSN
jgi:hypothetical protein